MPICVFIESGEAPLVVLVLGDCIVSVVVVVVVLVEVPVVGVVGVVIVVPPELLLVEPAAESVVVLEDGLVVVELDDVPVVDVSIDELLLDDGVVVTSPPVADVDVPCEPSFDTRM